MEAYLNECLFLLGYWPLKTGCPDCSPKPSHKFLKSILSSLSSCSWWEDQSTLVCNNSSYLPSVFLAKPHDLLAIETLGLCNSPKALLASGQRQTAIKKSLASCSSKSAISKAQRKLKKQVLGYPNPLRKSRYLTKSALRSSSELCMEISKCPNFHNTFCLIVILQKYYKT